MNRRSLILGAASAPFAGAALAGELRDHLPIPSPMTSEALLARYLAFLAHEHRAVLAERIVSRAPADFDRKAARDIAPMFWMPTGEPDVVAKVEGSAPANRALGVLTAAGL